MKTFLFLVAFLLSSPLLSQMSVDNGDCVVSERALEHLIYYPHLKNSPRLKVTCRTAFNKDSFEKYMDSNEFIEMFDDVEFSQFLKYNLRIRWRTKNKYNIFVGAQTIGAANPGPGQTSYYFGFKKRF